MLIRQVLGGKSCVCAGTWMVDPSPRVDHCAYVQTRNCPSRMHGVITILLLGAGQRAPVCTNACPNEYLHGHAALPMGRPAQIVAWPQIPHSELGTSWCSGSVGSDWSRTRHSQDSCRSRVVFGDRIVRALFCLSSAVSNLESDRKWSWSLWSSDRYRVVKCFSVPSSVLAAMCVVSRLRAVTTGTIG